MSVSVTVYQVQLINQVLARVAPNPDESAPTTYSEYYYNTVHTQRIETKVKNDPIQIGFHAYILAMTTIVIYGKFQQWWNDSLPST